MSEFSLDREVWGKGMILSALHEASGFFKSSQAKAGPYGFSRVIGPSGLASGRFPGLLPAASCLELSLASGGTESAEQVLNGGQKPLGCSSILLMLFPLFPHFPVLGELNNMCMIL